MESMNKDGIKYSDMNTEGLIARMAELEALKRDQNATLRTIDPISKNNKDMNRPLLIWSCLQEKFGNDYFVEVIEDEYGISPGSNDNFSLQLENHFNS